MVHDTLVWWPFVFLGWLAAACTAGEESMTGAVTVATDRPGKLVLQDTLVIPTDSITEPQQYYSQITADGKYIVFNYNNNCLQIYSIRHRTLLNKICFAKDGPHAIGINGSFYYHNHDSIFFLEDYAQHNIKLFDRHGKLRKYWHLNFPEPYEEYWIGLNEIFARYDYSAKNHTIVFPLYPDEESRSRTFYQKSRLCSFNLQTEEYNFFGGFPEVFYKSEDLYEQLEFINYYSTPTQLIAWYHPTKTIYVYDRQNFNQLKFLRIPSRSFKKETRPLLQYGMERADPQEQRNYLLTAGYTAMMITSPSGRFHYRLIKLPAPLQYADGSIRQFHDKPFAIQALDSAFNVIDEISFPGGQFDFYQTFAWQDKLYVSMNNPLSEHFNEEAMQLAVFELK